MVVTEQIDQAKAEAFGEKVLSILNGGALGLMISIGHRTGLFDAMGRLEPSTCDRIAHEAELRERYVREWLGAMVTGGIVEYDATARTYHLPVEHAAMLTRALAEIRRLGTQLGGQPETFSGLAGVGDLILTATGDLSRNRRVGLALASGKSLPEAIAALGGEVAEGVATAPALLELAAAAGVEMPISEMVRGILAGETSPADAVRRLMTRSLKEEKS